MAERLQEANRGNLRQVHDTQDSPGRIQVLASRSQPLFLFNLFPVRSAAGMGRAWWSTTLSSKVNLPHAIDLRTKCGATLVTCLVELHLVEAHVHGPLPHARLLLPPELFFNGQASHTMRAENAQKATTCVCEREGVCV